MDGKIVYEDKQILVLHKPAGIPVQTKRLGEKDVVSILKNYRAQKKEEPYIAVVHRLDQPVEGLLLAAKTREAAGRLSAQLQKSVMDKYYRAMVWNRRGCPMLVGEEGSLADFLLRDGKENVSVVVSERTKGAKQAKLSYSVLQTRKDLAELSVHLETGRHHQIRVQMANARMPLVGDKKYGHGEYPGLAVPVKHIALCSEKIVFMHPKTGKKMEFVTEPTNPVFRMFSHNRMQNDA